MNYSPIKCPSCGSGSIVPAENGRIFCRHCDQFFEGGVASVKSPGLPMPEERKMDWVLSAVLTLIFGGFIYTVARLIAS